MAQKARTLIYIRGRLVLRVIYCVCLVVNCDLQQMEPLLALCKSILSSYHTS